MMDEPKLLRTLGVSVTKLCRNTYYGTVRAQKLAEGTVPVLVWLLNRKIFPEEFHCLMHKCVTEMCWIARPLKAKVLMFMNSNVLHSYKHNKHYIFTLM